MVLVMRKVLRSGVAALLPLLTGCAGTLPLYPFGVPDGSLQLVQVGMLATKEQIVANREEVYDPLVASGVAADEIGDGSVAVGLVVCCGKSLARASRVNFYVPKGLQVAVGDIVEIRSGRAPGSDGPGQVNRATRVRQKMDDRSGACRWDPPEDKLLKVLYCDWMPSEGWTKEGRIPGAFVELWIKKP